MLQYVFDHPQNWKTIHRVYLDQYAYRPIGGTYFGQWLFDNSSAALYYTRSTLQIREVYECNMQYPPQEN